MNGVYSILFPGESPARLGCPKGGPPRAFIAGPENRLIGVALQSLLVEQPCAYSPLVICGPTGTGKSHLAVGMYEHLSRSRDIPAELVTGLEFVQRLAHAVQNEQMAAWRKRFRGLQLLVLDDLSYLSTKPAAQLELIYTLDAVRDNDGMAVLTSCSSPRENVSLLPALRSRLAAGLEVPLSAPGLQARSVLVRQLAELCGLALTDELCDLLAARGSASVPELRGLVSQLQLYCKSHSRPLDESLIREFLTQKSTRSAPALRSIASLTAKHFDLRVTDLKSPSRERPIVTARCVAMYLARELTDKSLAEIGNFFGGRDHTTVLHGCRRTAAWIKTDLHTRQAVSELRTRMKGT